MVDWRDPQPDEGRAGDVSSVQGRAVWVLDDGVVFELPLRYADAFELQRASFLIGGSAAMEATEKAAMAMTAERLTPLSKRFSEAEAVDPQTEAFLVGIARGLLGVAARQIHEAVQAKLGTLKPFIQKRLLERLDDARAEILAEAKRYFPASPNSPDVNMRSVQPDMAEFVAACTPLQRLKAQIDDAVSEQRAVLTASFLIGVGGMPLYNPEADRKINAEADRLGNEFRRLRLSLNEDVIRVALDFPIAWKIWSRAPLAPDRRLELQALIFSVLKETSEANEQIAKQIERNPDSVWHYGVVVEEVLDLQQVPSLACVRVAARELCFSAGTGRELISNLTLATGIASLGVAVAGSVVAPPVAIAVLVADAALSVIDAFAEVEDYLRRSQAYQACLDPRKAIGVEPSLATAAFVIGMDIFGAATGVRVK
jgi:hypothetical protein